MKFLFSFSLGSMIDPILHSNFFVQSSNYIFLVGIILTKLKQYFNNKKLQNECIFRNLGGLDSGDQSRSRSRSSFMWRLTFENRREYPSCQDQLFFFSVEIFKIEIFRSRFIFVEIFIEIVETNQDCRDLSRLSRFIKIF
jgi:hypothetical protein